MHFDIKALVQESEMIEVRRVADGDPSSFEVRVREGGGETRHHVTLSRRTFERLAGGAETPERCVEAAFRFLLDREPKESILARFDLTVISRYFPEFERDLPRYLGPVLKARPGWRKTHSGARGRRLCGRRAGRDFEATGA
jgi:hypothetical protein